MVGGLGTGSELPVGGEVSTDFVAYSSISFFSAASFSFRMRSSSSCFFFKAISSCSCFIFKANAFSSSNFFCSS